MMTDFASIPATIRTFEKKDSRACEGLYHEAILGGTLAENDTGVDIDDIATAYLSSPGSHFWVAENDGGEVVGMIGVQQHDAGIGEIRRLRVRPDHRRRGIGSALLETALRFCRDRQHLKVKLDTFMEREPAISLFEKYQFRHSHVREVGDRQLLYFYLDLYLSEPSDKKKQP
ncbi:MAG: GNAT family N-acetyltransferase [Tepidisphaeraceae bacterium]|jgi:ribosomal protein S18 acetylase RimI-like enzyme